MTNISADINFTKRAQKAIEIFEQSPSKSFHSFLLNGPLRTNFSPRAICEARKAGFVITSVNETLGNARGVRYTLISTPSWYQTIVLKPILSPMRAIQGVLL